MMQKQRKRDRQSYLAILMILAVPLWLWPGPGLAQGTQKVVLLPWQVVGTESQNSSLGRDWLEALRWLIKLRYKVHLVSPSSQKDELARLGYSAEDSWNLKMSGELMAGLGADYLVLGKLYLDSGRASGRWLLLARQGNSGSRVVFKRKFSLFGQGEHAPIKGALRQALGRVDKALAHSWPVQESPVSGQAKPGGIEIAWLVDNGSGMLYHKKSLRDSLAKTWHKLHHQFDFRYVAFRVMALFGEQDSSQNFVRRKGRWRSSFAKIKFGSSAQGRFARILRQKLSRLKWSRGVEKKFVILLTNGKNISRDLYWGNILQQLQEEQIRFFVIAYPGMDRETTDYLNRLVRRSRGIFYPVTVLTRGFSVDGRVDLAYCNGHWFRFRGPDNRFELNQARVLIKQIAQDPTRRFAGSSPWSYEPGDSWSHLGYYPAFAPQTVWGKVGRFKKWRQDTSFDSRDNSVQAPFAAMERWLKRYESSSQGRALYRVLVRQNKITTWLNLYKQHREQLSWLWRAKSKGFEVTLAARISPGNQGGLSFKLAAQGLRFYRHNVRPPDLYSTDFRKVMQKKDYYFKHGLGPKKLWFFPVKVIKIKSLKQDDILDF